ncbi:MAG: STAS domain-containing protein [Marinobacter sp.]|uniref:lipid asymmetry maintenance protein MlaB n=1 Tax=Marinobacter sp. TaxID=50741 RepID=UPI0034A07D40
MTAGAAPSIRLRSEGTLAVSGEVTADNVVALRQEGERQLAASGCDVEITLAGVENAHSILLSLLLCWQRAAKVREQKLIYSGMSERLSSLSALSGLSQHLPGFHQAPPVPSKEHTLAL